MEVRVFRSLVAIALGLAVVGAGAAGAQDIPLDKITVPDGFTIEVYASDVPNARSMALSPTGTLFVSTRRAGIVYAVLDRDQDQTADEVITIATGLNTPNGVAIRDGALFVAELNRILRYDDIEARLGNPPAPVVVYDALPSERMHGWKFIRFGPDGKLYVPVGAPCNICDRTGEDERFATITRMNPDGGEHEVFAHGIRNSVGFDWHPVTGELWFTSNGRDRLGDDVPGDTLNHAPEIGMHFGYPFCHQGDIPDPEFGEQRACDEFTPPAEILGPHVASLGMRFYDGSMFPNRYRNQIFIAEHGSWNRSPAAGHTGYRITVATLDGNRVTDYAVFAEGWLDPDNTSWGRPTDIQVMPDGALLVTDDRVGAIYRISYGPR
ncbi:MAG: sorbosone dehydrogenase family protein [Acidobacteria bacterium]|nr:MAG: sorbosone dehydrogenase family protein [Acidobacteriota bacterium]